MALQKDPKTKKLFIIDMACKELTRTQKSWSISEIELYAVVTSLEKFKMYLSATSEINIISDHLSLAYWKTIRNSSGRLARWCMLMSPYKINFQIIPGSKNYLADILSRRNYPDDVTPYSEDSNEIQEVVLQVDCDRIIDDSRTMPREIMTGQHPKHSVTDTNEMINDVIPALYDARSAATHTTTNTTNFCRDPAPTVSFDEVKQITEAIMTLNYYSNNKRNFSDRILDNNRMKLKTVSSDDNVEPIYFTTTTDKLFTDEDYIVTCQNFESQTNVVDHIDLSQITLQAIETGTNTTEHTLQNDDIFTPEGGVSNISDLVLAQRSDAKLNETIRYLKNKELPNDETRSRRIIAESEFFFIDPNSDLLFHWRKTRSKRPQFYDNYGKQLCIPESKVSDLLKLAHNPASGGHLSADYIYLKLSGWAYFDQMYSRIFSFCRNCETCQISKSTSATPKPAPLTPTEVFETAFEAYVFDLLKLSVTPRGNCYLLVIIDKYSSYPILIPTKDGSAKTVADCIFDHVISHFGVMKHLYSDRAKAFMSSVKSFLNQRLGITHRLSSSRKPSTNGRVEELNRVVLNILRTLPESGSSWDLFAPAIALGLRASPRNNLGDLSPAQIIYGKNIRTPEQAQVSTNPSNNQPHSLNEHMILLQEKLSLAQAIVSKARQQYIQSMKQSFDKNADFKPFEIGETVLKLREYFDTKSNLLPKMFQRYTTPYIVVELNLDFHTYKLKDAASGKVDQNYTHFSKLKRFREPGDKPTDPIINHDEIQRNESVQNQVQTHAPTSNNPPPIVNEHESPPSVTANAPPTEVIDTAGAGHAPHLSDANDIPHTESAIQPPSDVSGPVRRSPRLESKRVNYADMIKTTPLSKKSDVSKAKSILKVTPAEQPLNYFARFKMPGKPINGIPNYKKIKILEVITSRKSYGILHFYVKLESQIRNSDLAWVNEYSIDPKIQYSKNCTNPFKLI